MKLAEFRIRVVLEHKEKPCTCFGSQCFVSDSSSSMRRSQAFCASSIIFLVGLKGAFPYWKTTKDWYAGHAATFCHPSGSSSVLQSLVEGRCSHVDLTTYSSSLQLGEEPWEQHAEYSVQHSFNIYLAVIPGAVTCTFLLILHPYQC